MSHTADVTASVVPHGTKRVVPGQNHNVSTQAMALVLREFFV